MLAEGSRASLGNLQAALEMLDYPDLDAPTRERFIEVVRDEVRAMSQRIARPPPQRADLKTRWPLEDMLGADLLAAACRRIEAASALRAASSEADADALAEGRQLLAAAGADLPRRPPGRRVRRRAGAPAPDADAKAGAAQPRPGLVGPGR